MYRVDSAPFNPDKRVLGLATELKQPARALKRMSHTPAPRPSNAVKGWLEKFDTELRSLGITPQSAGGVSASRSATSSIIAEPTIEEQLTVLLEHVEYSLTDNRKKGGALQVKLTREDSRARLVLMRLGFKAMNQNPLTFWRS
ncbi:hypothetical protein D9M69_654570 [compost metagenome]